MKISTAARNALANAFAGLFDAGAGPGYVEVYTGAPPTNPQTAHGGTLLGTCVLGDPAFAAASGGTIVANAIANDDDADATGVAASFRAYDSSDNVIEDGTISEAGGGGEMIIDDANIVAGGVISITGWSITMPE